MKNLTLILTFFSIIAAFSQATPTLLTQPQPQQINLTRLSGSGCDYKVTIKTSCESPLYTRDQIGVSFGDAYGSKIQVSRLDDPSSGIFKRCTTVTFTIDGPCVDRICKLYLYRSGRDGWVVETVLVDDQVYPPVPFYFNTFIPDDDGYGFSYCKRL